MRISTNEITISIDRAEVAQIADDLNTIVNHLAKLFAEVGDIDTGHPMADLHSAAYRIDDFRMQVERLRNG